MPPPAFLTFPGSYDMIFMIFSHFKQFGADYFHVQAYLHILGISLESKVQYTGMEEHYVRNYRIRRLSRC